MTCLHISVLLEGKNPVILQSNCDRISIELLFYGKHSVDNRVPDKRGY